MNSWSSSFGTYRDEYPRRSEVKPFTPVDEREAAARDLVLRYDTETGYMGYTIESGQPLFNVSLYDRVVIVRSGGVAGVHNTLDKMYVDLDILYCAMEEPGRVFTIAYRDLEDYVCIKRCSLDRVPDQPVVRTGARGFFATGVHAGGGPGDRFDGQG